MISKDLGLAKTSIQTLASKLFDEQGLNKKQTDTVLTLLCNLSEVHFEKGTPATSTETLTYVEEPIGQAAAKRKTRVAYPVVGEADSESDCESPCDLVDSHTDPEHPLPQDFGATVTESESDQEWAAELPECNICDPDEGIYVVVDEGCNTTCHGGGWGSNADAKLEKQEMFQAGLLSGYWASFSKLGTRLNGPGGVTATTLGGDTFRLATCCVSVRKGTG